MSTSDHTHAAQGKPTLTVTHTHETGTVIEGTSKGDGVWEIVKPLGWRFSRHVGIYVRGSRDKDANRALIRRTVEALTAAEYPTTDSIDNDPRPAAVRRADAAERADDRADRLDARAERAAGEAVARRDASRRITDGIPFGQPVQPVGHHSRNAHLNALDRSQRHQEKSWEAADKARRAADGAAAVRSHASYRNNPRAIMRRIEKLETDRRAYARKLEGYTREQKNGRGEVIYRDTFQAATGDRAEDLTRWDARDAEEIEHLRGYLAELSASGEFTAWTPADFQAGDLANVGGDWYTVTRINRKSVSVRNRFYGDSGRSTPVTFDEIHGRRRDDMQWDSPTGEPWPVALAVKCARWRNVQRSASIPAKQYDADTRHAGYAVRIVHGLGLDASDREVATIADSIEGTDARRALYAAYLAVFNRLQTGETVPAIVADVEPVTGVPAWRIPADRETVTMRAGRGWPVAADTRFVGPGDLIVGRREQGGFGQGKPSLVRSFCGPVASVSDVDNRREAGDWVTITLTDGETRECKIGEWYEVHPAGTWETDTDSSTPDAEPAENDSRADADQRRAAVVATMLAEHVAAMEGIAVGLDETADRLASDAEAASKDPDRAGLIAGRHLTGEALADACLAEARGIFDQAAGMRREHATDSDGCGPWARTEADDGEPVPVGATVTVYGVRDGQEDEMFSRERVTLDYDTAAEAQALADETAASQPITPGVGIRVLVGRDSVNHEYAAAERAAFRSVEAYDSRDDAPADVDAFVSGWAALDLGASL